MTSVITTRQAMAAPATRADRVPLGRSRARHELPPLTPRLQLVRAVLVFVFALSFALFLQLVLVSRLQAASAQQRAFQAFRSALAKGSVAVGATDQDGKEVGLGTPLAYLEIPSIGVRQVVLQGTTPSVLFDGPGHRRDTPLPGQFGTSVLFGRRAIYGGPFADIASLRKGSVIRATTGQGVFTYKVIDVRVAGEQLPPAMKASGSRLTLVTGAGRPFLPNGSVYVDADLDGQAVGGPARLVTEHSLPSRERALASDTSTLWALALWLQALIAVSVGAVWAWHRWGRAQAWIVFLPLALLIGLAAAGEVARLLPNLM